MAFGNVGRQVNQALGGSGRSTASGKSNGSSGNGPGSQAAQKAKLGNLPAGVKTQGAGTTTGRSAGAADPGRIQNEGDAAPEGENSITGGPVSANPNNPRTQNIARSASNYTGEGATPYIADPSLGQIFGALMNLAPVAGTLNNTVGAGIDIANGGGFGDAYDGGAFGQAIDKMRGVKPGKVTGATNPDAARGNPGRGTVVAPAPSYGRVEDDGQPSLASAFNKIISAPGVWPPVRASAGI